MGIFDKIKDKFKGSKAEEPSLINNPDDGKKDYNKLPLIAKNSFLKYTYESNIYFLNPDNFSKVIGNGGLQITFEFEPDNTYDPKAIKIVTLENEPIGYVHKGHIQDMIHDWDEKGWGIAAHLNKYSVEDKTATYKIGFYKPLSYLTHKEFKVTKITKKHDEFSSFSRFEALEFCSEGDGVTIEYDSFTDSYIVSDGSGSEFGEMPKSFEKFADGHEKFIGVLSSIDTFETAKATVEVYIVE